MRAFVLFLMLSAAAMAADGTTSLKILANTSRTLDLGTVSFPLSWSSAEAWTDGTGANQYQVAWTDTRTTDGTGEDLDLVAALTDAFGQTLTFTSIKVLAVSASDSNTQPVAVGVGTHPVASLFANTSDIILVRPGGTLTLVAPDTTGFAVGADGVADDLKVKCSTTANVTYSIMVLGEGSGS